MVFLNRNVKPNSVIMVLFSNMSMLVLIASATAFLSAIPLVTTESQCLEEDKNGHRLICYTIHSDYPINCTALTKQNATNVTYTCYAWTLSIFGVAFAAAMGIFKFTVVFVTNYVRLFDCIQNRGKHWKKAWKCLVMFVACICTLITIVHNYVNVIYLGRHKTSDNYLKILGLYTSLLINYKPLPMWLCLGLAYMTWYRYLEEHCEQAEYCTLSPDQLPPGSSPQQERQVTENEAT